MTNEQPVDLMTIPEVAALWRVDVKTIIRWDKAGRFPGQRRDPHPRRSPPVPPRPRHGDVRAGGTAMSAAEAERKALLARIDALTPGQMHTALIYLSGWTPAGTSHAIDHALELHAPRADGSIPDPGPQDGAP